MTTLLSNKTSFLFFALVSMTLVSADQDFETYSKVVRIEDQRFLMNETYMVDDALDGNFTDDALDGNFTDDDTMAISHDHFEGMENEHKELEHDTMDMHTDTDTDMKEESGASNSFYKIGASIAAGAFIATVAL